MKRTLLYILSFILILSSCRRHDDDELTSPEGYTTITFKARITDLENVNVRDVDPDGLGVNNMILFCFNEFGLYISKSVATLKQQDSESGTYEAVIPNYTEIIHFLGNHSEGLFDDSDFPGQTESMVIANMEGGSGMLVYWSRFQLDKESDDDLRTQLANLSYTIGDKTYNGIKLIRNQAKVSISDWSNEFMTISGFRTVNIPAFGTVAPHHHQKHFKIVREWEELEDFVTLPDNKAKVSDIVDINTKEEDYIFETDNEGDNLTSVIIKGRPTGSDGEELYYRIVMQNEDGSNFMIRRNHHYKINIKGNLNYGVRTFEEALNAPATNNVWISIDDWVNEISDGNETLWVENTSFVLSSEEYGGKNFTIKYKYTNLEGGNTPPAISWIENNVAYNNINNKYNSATGEGEITINLHPMHEDNEQQSGTLMIKHGKLQRKVDIILIGIQSFTPAWVSSQVFSGSAHEHVTVMFTIPETCPASLFPFTVLISANHLDIRPDSGMELPLIFMGDEDYFGTDWDGIAYKYAYTVTAPGKHRVFFQTILTHDDNDTEEVHLEAKLFETITKTVTFTGHDNHKAIFVDGLNEYGNQHAEDEILHYMLVPRKKASPHMFTISLKERHVVGDEVTYTAINHADQTDYEQWNRNLRDEFLIYTKYLSFYEEYLAEHPELGINIADMIECENKLIHEDDWSSNGRVMGFRTYDNGNNNYGLQADGTYNIYMVTNGISDVDVLRIASNNSMSKHLFEKDREGNLYGDVPYGGNEYRSFIFDVSQYRPFRFAPQIKIYYNNGQLKETYGTLLSNEVDKDREEELDEIYFCYEPGEKVDILLDITSFKGSDGKSVHPFGEMFGESLDIYIDAPMLSIDMSRVPENWLAKNNPNLTEDKLRRHPTIEGRYIYTVDKYREIERNYGQEEAHNNDASIVEYDDYGRVVTVDGEVNQSGERKCLPFIKSTITTKYNINISSEKDKVVFWDKTFKVKTKHIKGDILYNKAGNNLEIPKDSFVAFVRHLTGARIGVMTIYEDGKYELNLRHEYNFDWNGDPIELFYIQDDKTYTVQIEDLAELYRMANNNETIILH